MNDLVMLATRNVVEGVIGVAGGVGHAGCGDGRHAVSGDDH